MQQQSTHGECAALIRAQRRFHSDRTCRAVAPHAVGEPELVCVLHTVYARAAAAFVEIIAPCDHRVVAGLVAEKFVERGHILIKI